LDDLRAILAAKFNDYRDAVEYFLRDVD
jgi:hypothetical protein